MQKDLCDPGVRAELGLPPTQTTIQIPDTRLGLEIQWQCGPMESRNGVTLEEMIEHCIDRLQAFQKTQFKCRENALAITALEESRNWLLQRQRDRDKRGVLGTEEQ